VLSDAKGEVQRGLEVIEYACGIPTLLRGSFSEQASTGIDVYSIRQPLGVVRRDHAVQLPGDGPDVDVGAGARVREHVRPQAVREGPVALDLRRRAAQGGGLPDGVFNVVHGDKVAVDAILEHPGRRGGQLRRLDADRALHLQSGTRTGSACRRSAARRTT
jgi:malonate-semialdehyde dehydrogenase (acetylating)/methylmalonate-semialdehyde dehydrogenase